MPQNHRTEAAEKFAIYMSDRLSPRGMNPVDLSRARSIAMRWITFNTYPTNDLLVAYYHEILTRIDLLAPARSQALQGKIVMMGTKTA